MRWFKLSFVLPLFIVACNHSNQNVSTSDSNAHKVDTSSVKGMLQPSIKNTTGLIFSSDHSKVIGDTTIEKKKIFYTQLKFEPYISFDEFKVSNVYHGKKAPINYNSNKTAKKFNTVITNAYNNSTVNFGGNYIFAMWGCGTDCQQCAIIDLTDGRVFDGPVASKLYDFRDNSRMLIVNPPDSSGLTKRLTETSGPLIRLIKTFLSPLMVVTATTVRLQSWEMNTPYRNQSSAETWNIPPVIFQGAEHFFHTEFSAPVNPSYQPYNTFAFRGDRLTDYGLHFDWQYKNFNFFGEGAKSEPGGIGGISGLIVSVDPRVDLAFVYRNYAKDFHSIYSNAFGESSTANNESGFYSGVIIRPATKWEIDAYADFFRRPWLAYLVNAPSNGTDYLIQLNYRPSKTLVIYLRWKDESKQTNSSTDETMRSLVNIEKENLRFNLSYKASASVTLNSRAEWVYYHEEKKSTSHGFLAYQEINYKLPGFPLRLDGRFCLFDADTYDARIYAYENDVLYSFSVPAFSNRGIRWYLLARYNLMRGVDVWLRFAQTYYSDLSTIGSGLDVINGNTKSEVKVEVRFRF